MNYEDIIKLTEDMNDDEDTSRLEKAMEYFCGMWDIREGFKHAIKLSLEDQYQNHPEDQEPEHLEMMKAILLSDVVLDECPSADVVCEADGCNAHTSHGTMFYSQASHIYCSKHIIKNYKDAK